MGPGILFYEALELLLLIFRKVQAAIGFIFKKISGKLVFRRCFFLHKPQRRTILDLSLLFLIQISIVFLLSSCGKQETEPMPRREVSIYSERTVSTVSPYRLAITCDYGNLEFYNWDRKEIKFEVTHKVRAGRTEEELQSMLEKFRIKTSEKNGNVSFLCGYNGKEGKYEDTFSLIRIFMPEKPGAVECKVAQGKMNFFDDLNCDLNLEVGKTEVEINRLKGVIKYTGKNGNLRISSGELNSNSSITTTTGNIRIKSDFETPGNYSLNTGTGIIELDIPSSLNAVFENNGRTDATEASSGEDCSQFLLKCGVGKIDIKRF